MEMTEQEKLWLQEMYHLQLTQLYRNLNKYPGTQSAMASREQINRVDNRLKELGLQSYQCQHPHFFRR